jgi:hypothetical protein
LSNLITNIHDAPSLSSIAEKHKLTKEYRKPATPPKDSQPSIDKDPECPKVEEAEGVHYWHKWSDWREPKERGQCGESSGTSTLHEKG